MLPITGSLNGNPTYAVTTKSLNLPQQVGALLDGLCVLNKEACKPHSEPGLPIK